MLIDTGVEIERIFGTAQGTNAVLVGVRGATGFD